MSKSDKEPLLRIQHLSKHYGTSGSWSNKRVQALEDVNLDVYEGETIGIVGESGSGKTTLGRLILRLLEPTGGSVCFQGKDIFKLSDAEMRKLRRHIQIVFQDSMASLNPRKTVGKILRQPFLTFGLTDKKDEAEARARKLLEEVGLSPPDLYMDRYPHQLSGGQRQRVCIAYAMAARPKLVVADEPVSALDISVRAQILKLMIKLKQEHGLTYLFISHDLNVIRAVCDRVVVVHHGNIVEIATVKELFEKPTHPYTKALLSSIPSPNPDQCASDTIKNNISS